MLTNCAAGLAPPRVKLNVSGLLGTLIVGAEVTLSVTPIVTGLPVAPVAVTVIEPLYVPAANPDGFTETLIGLLTVPPGGAGSQALPPLVVDAEVVYVNPLVPVMFTVCWAGFAPPSVKLNVSGVLGIFIVGAVTCSVTLIVAGLPVAPVEVTVIEPV
jgi:hypothetical protein